MIKKNLISEVTTKFRLLKQYAHFLFFSKKLINNRVRSLAPKILTSDEDILRIKPYLDRIKEAIDSNQLSNIALTGSYGSGKTTILKTFQNINKPGNKNDYKFINISLASFKTKIEESDNIERLIELSILQQIIYHVDPKEIPDSRFKRIINITDFSLFWSMFWFVLWLISTIIIYKFDYIEKLNPVFWDYQWLNIDLVATVLFISFFLGIAIFTKDTIRVLSNSKINRISLKGELELGEDITKSILNQHVDEIIYFFEKTKFNIVIIEDLDRFKNTEIFTKLREVNLLLNNSKLIKKHIVFIYGIRDDIFKGKERVKFFDYIIPVIPFINPSNANEQLTTLIKEAGLVDSFSQSFIEEVVTFIDDIDMRLLLNIFHEYELYKDSLGDVLNQDNLLAIIIYKNIHPSDFSDLGKRSGALFGLISNKNRFVDELKSKIEIELIQTNERIIEVEEHFNLNIRELKAVYINSIYNEIKGITELQIAQKWIPIADLANDDNFDQMIIQNTVRYRHVVYSHSNVYIRDNSLKTFSFSELSKSVNDHQTYIQRSDLVKDKTTSKLESLKVQAQILRNEINDIESLEINEIFKRINIEPYLNEFFIPPLDKYNNLVRSLILNGNINENYDDYISLFHGINLTKNDYIFVRSVISGKNLPFDYKLERLQNIIKKISSIRNYSKSAILNFQLINYLLKNKFKYESEIDKIMELLSIKGKYNNDFVDKFISYENHEVDVFINYLTNAWTGFWTHIELESRFPKKKIDDYLVKILLYSDLRGIEKNNVNSILEKYIAKKKDFFSLFKNNSEESKIKKVIKQLNINFEIISYPQKDSSVSLFDYIFENNYYDINHNNLKIILENLPKTKSTKSKIIPTYKTIIDFKNENLIDYVNSSLDYFVSNVLLNLDGDFKESEKSMLLLINSNSISLENKLALLQLYPDTFSKLSEINSLEVKTKLIEKSAIFPSWLNVYDYYLACQENTLNKTLIDFMNQKNNFRSLGNENLEKLNIAESLKKEFALVVIYSNELLLESHEIVRDLYYSSWIGLSFNGLSYDKVESMIKGKFIKLSLDYFQKLKEGFPNLHITLIELNLDIFLNSAEDYSLFESDYILLLKSKILADKQKSNIIIGLDDDFVLGNDELAKLACHIYADTETYGLNHFFLVGLFSKTDSVVDRLKLFNFYSHNLDASKAVELIKKLPDNYNRVLKPKKRTKFLRNNLNEQFANNLERLKIISSVTYKEEELTINSKY
ncbi:hypothetical protein [Maribacter sp. IgM3_T14_3]|uniref:YobI family P-loop NTPase n=1 Tax=Maribacter sp. IgM3_T14_3 TaxID=3415140 RepID=UPI003C6FE373